ncbi:putative glutamine synthetase [Helianthus annuus]|uniref:protein fluG isoform X2 n=1 Tax=Helianthus annuus TaxID=4232 RepID=UPI000B8FC938|nr:protein fluG isoform X2 [Helianthus annuus]KAJ0570058.1 putative glutamine synthetase [Helianthus annuus]KAJ0576770.1 putative glutamine synthetase [Helianthus annuus]KAJ0584388.1 putative glutamine synthetase [Helianthus annuus]KAJ0747014.1 putative glutamine synthetase [Helianthus annuus]KAJ0918745.1 putative glutamine synthetase [Helianthus annuus]
MDELREAVERAELVDGHAHNIVALDSSLPFLSCFSEASGKALAHVPSTLNFKRSLRDIARLYGSDLSLEGVQQYRLDSGIEIITKICFKAAGISTVLVDDGLVLDKMLGTDILPCAGRILRIERLAEDILDQGIKNGIPWTMDTFTDSFLARLKSADATKVVGLKTIAAYRSGLEINPNVTQKEAAEGLAQVLLAGSPVRITNKHLIDYIIVRSLEVALCFDWPMQIHTGFGDKDLDLRQANPLHLRNLLEDRRFLDCRIVLLHASYPFSREASYLASVYHQVYLDFGLAVPKLSVHGMISSLKQLLELAPLKKVMFSTDGCAFPETFYLGAKRARDVVFSVLRDACNDGDLSIDEAVEAVADIFAENAKKFYGIGTAVRSDTLLKLDNDVRKEVNSTQQDVVLVRVLWVDASGQHRCRVVPRKRFDSIVKENGLGLTCASMGMSSAMDGPADETNLTGTGEIRLIPDLSTRCKIPWAMQEEMVLAYMHSKPGQVWDYCPRETLRRLSQLLKQEFNLEMNAGFENEFYLLKSQLRDGQEEWVSFDTSRYCATSSFDAASPILHEVVNSLHFLNIDVEQLHAEAGNGQFEIALRYTTCTKAADNLIYAREVIRSVARKHGLLATFMPKYALDDIGSGSHVHISLSENGENVFAASDRSSSRHGMSKIGEEFMAGVLHHLPSLLAFTAPLPNSYDRIQPNTWSGAYLCWGKENREAPIRTACPPGVPDGIVSNFEIKAFDGCANPHLALAAVIASGIDGLRRHLSLSDPVDENPDILRDKLQRLPVSLAESVEALAKDTVLEALLGEKLLVAIKGVRKAEIKYYSENKDAYKKLIYQY